MCPEDNTALQADPTVIGESAADPLIGHTLDEKYSLEERLGVGGMGTVYRARHLLIDRAVAVKVLHQRFVEDEAARTRFHREAKAAGRLQHPNAVTVTDFGQTSDGYVYIVMELLVGRTLRDVLAKEAPLDPARTVSLMLQISAAVSAAHEAGIIHRDLKPANIFIVQRAEVPSMVKVLDFGIAKLFADSLDEDDPQTLTLFGAMIGTPRYMSPEQCDGAELTPAADVYSLGVIFYEMLAGTVPFSGSTPLAIAMKHATEAPRSPREIVASIPEELEKVVLHALEKRPEDRPANAAEFRRELLETAERLGLEHAAITSAPDLAALRDIGTESPSGRLVIDISKLRENRAATTSAGELTVISEPQKPRVLNGPESSPVGEKRNFPRVAVPFGNRRRNIRAGAVISLLVLAMVFGATFLAMRSNTSTPAETVVVASPSPTAEPSPSPSPVARRTEQQKKPGNENSNNNNSKKDSKVGSILKKAGRILKKPF
ncbi:MAG TPA: protein kinase [Pyrinomonadaceae bacterium]|nr:protein kinase [Pyrinomonadaceae bacterium]